MISFIAIMIFLCYVMLVISFTIGMIILKFAVALVASLISVFGNKGKNSGLGKG